MAEERSELERLREAARQARQEAARVREQARELERKLRGEAREQKRRLRSERRGQRQERRQAARAERSQQGQTTSEVLALEGVRLIALHQTAGQLTVRSCETGESPEITTVADRATPKLSVSREGDILKIDVRLSTGWLFRRRRGANTTLALQSGPEALDFDLGAGDVQLRGVAADRMKVSTGAGVIGSVASSGNLDARAGAGKVTIYSHHGEVRCNTGTGDALVDIAEALPGDYRIDVGIGRADLRFPPEAKVHPDVRSGIGRGRQEFPDAGPGAPIKATVSAGIGEASIRQREDTKQRETNEAAPSRTRSAKRSGADTRQAEELRILQLLEQGRVSVAEAGELIAALHGASRAASAAQPELDEDGSQTAAPPQTD